jgi:hypothetical protein
MGRERAERQGAGDPGPAVRAVEIDAEVRQVRTMADGTVSVMLNLPEYCMPQAQALMGWVHSQVRAVIEIVDIGR